MPEAVSVEDLPLTRAELLAEIDRLKWMIEANLQVPWSADAAGNANDFSQRWLELSGLSREEALNGGWLNAAHADDAHIIKAAWAKSIATGEPYDVRYRMRLADGKYRWIRSRAQARKGSAGHILAWYGSTEDVHEYRVADERLAVTADALPALIFHIDADLIYRFANRRFDEWFGRPREEAIGKTVRETVGEATFSKILPFLNAALSGQSAEWEAWVDFPMGRRFVRTFYVPSRNESDEVTGLDVLSSDLTEARIAQEKLQENEELLRNLADHVDQLVWSAHADGSIFWYNRRWYEYTGTTPEEMEGWGWQRVHDPEILPHVLVRWRASIATGQAFDMEFPLRRADGEFRVFLTRINPIRDENGTVVGWFGTNTDIQSQKEAEAELERRVTQRTEGLTRANRDLNEFAYSVAHDLRAPLRAIVSTSEIIKEEAADRLTPLEIEMLDRQSTNAVRLAKVVDDLLGFARLAKADLRNEPVDLSAIAFEAAREPLQRSKNGCRFSVEPGMTAVGDPSLLGYALTNLFDNAFKFSPNGGTVAFGKDEISYFVRDEGVGFDMKFADKLFVAFERLVDQETFEGTGVGLANVKRIVERHGGVIWAQSELEKGAVFRFTLG